jgi:uncharacterized membrane protein YeiH
MDLFGHYTFGDFLIIDLIAATTNAFNGAILSRQPSHYRRFTDVGIILIAVLGGIGGGVTRDILLNDVPSALTNPWYIILCVAAGLIALNVSRRIESTRVDMVFDFLACFSLPWYAAVGANKALETSLPAVAAVLIGVVGPTAGRFFIDLISGVTPQHFTRGEWFVGTAAVTSVVYILGYAAGLSIWPATILAFIVGFGIRFGARRLKWEEPVSLDEQGRRVLNS